MVNPLKKKSLEKEIIPATLGEWLMLPIGNYVRDWELARLDELTVDIFGFNALQIGLPELDALRSSRMMRRFLSAQEPSENHNVAVVHSYTDLPFATNSVDLVVLPHVLEFSAEPHQVLREVARVLIPEGQLIVCGFNPNSLWGLRNKRAGWFGSHFLPEYGEFMSVHRLKDWLKLLSMETNRGYFGCYSPPCADKKEYERYDFMEKAGNRWWPSLGGVYIIQAIKRLRGMTLIGPGWKNKKLSGAEVPAANRQIHERKK